MNPSGAPPSPAPSPETWSSSTAATPTANTNTTQSHTANQSNATTGSASAHQSSSSSRSSGGQFASNTTGAHHGRHHFNRDPASSYRPRQSRTTHYYTSGTAGPPGSVMAAAPGYTSAPPPPGMMMPPGFHHHGAGAYPRLHAPLDRRTGHVKFFNSTKGFGFIIPDVALDDAQAELEVFVHHTAITSPNRSFRSLAEGEPVEFDLVQGPKGYYSQNVTGPQGAPVRGDPKVLTIPRKPMPGFFHPRQGYPHEFANPADLVASSEHSPTTTGPADGSDPSASSSTMMPHHAMHPSMLPPHMQSLPPGAVMYFIPVPMSNPAGSGDASQDTGGGSGGPGGAGPTSPIPPSPGHAQQHFMYQPYGYPTYPMDASTAAAGGPQSPTSPVPSMGSPSSVAPPHPYMVPVPQGYPMPYAYMSPHMPLSPPGTSPMMAAAGAAGAAGDASFSTASTSHASGGFPGGMYGGMPPQHQHAHHLSMPISPGSHAASAADVEAQMASMSIGSGGGSMPRTDSGHDFQAPGKGTGSVRRSSVSASAGVEAAQEAAVVLQDDYPVEQ